MPRRLRIGYQSGRTLAADQGAFALTGIAASLYPTRKVTAAQGTFSVAGQSNTLTYSGAAAVYDNRIGFGTSSTFVPDIRPHASASLHQKIFVDNTTGSDSNAGTNPAAPKASIQSGWAAIRDGTGDWLMMARGTTYTGFLGSGADGNDQYLSNKSGLSAQYPILITTYDRTDPLNSAKWRLGRFTAGTNRSADTLFLDTAGSYMLIENMDYFALSPHIINNICNDRDRYFGLFNCRFRNCQVSLQCDTDETHDNNSQRARGNMMRACSIKRNPSGQGLYTWKQDGLIVEYSVFFHNGWSGPTRADGTQADIYKHNLYFGVPNDNNWVRNCVSAWSGSHGLQARGGGTITDNAFIRNPINCLIGGGNFYSTIRPLGVAYKVNRNVIVGSEAISAAEGNRGAGLAFINTNNDSANNADDNLIVNIEATQGGGFSALSATIDNLATTDTWIKANRIVVYNFGPKSFAQQVSDSYNPSGIHATLGYCVLPNDTPSGTNNTVPAVSHPFPTRTAATYAVAQGFANEEAMLDYWCDNLTTESGGTWVLNPWVDQFNAYMRAGFSLTA